MWLIVKNIIPRKNMVHFTIYDQNIECDAFINDKSKWLHINKGNNILNVKMNYEVSKDMFSDEDSATRNLSKCYQEGYCLSVIMREAKDRVTKKMAQRSFVDEQMNLKEMPKLEMFDIRFINGFK